MYRTTHAHYLRIWWGSSLVLQTWEYLTSRDCILVTETANCLGYSYLRPDMEGSFRRRNKLPLYSRRHAHPNGDFGPGRDTDNSDVTGAYPLR